MAIKERSLRYIRQSKLFDSIAAFNPKNTTTRGEFFLDMPYNKIDVEWNHMDQLHRPFIHNTYNENIRIALGRDYAHSLTRWGKWPFLITVTDMRVEEGLYYQTLVLAGLFYIHNTISMTEIEDKGDGNTLRLKLEWIIHSHWLLKPVHAVLGKMFYKLNVRLQEEDTEIRGTRCELRKKGYTFRSDPPDYYNSNLLTNNTCYPMLHADTTISLGELPMGKKKIVSAGPVDFLVLKEEKRAMIWPAACPHEGGNLYKGKLHDDCRMECPWHGLKFSAAILSEAQPSAEAYGFVYTLEGGILTIRNPNRQATAA